MADLLQTFQTLNRVRGLLSSGVWLFVLWGNITKVSEEIALSIFLGSKNMEVARLTYLPD
jgi:hypothetical protein